MQRMHRRRQARRAAGVVVFLAKKIGRNRKMIQGRVRGSHQTKGWGPTIRRLCLRCDKEFTARATGGNAICMPCKMKHRRRTTPIC
jgi:hypothetical protein